MGRKRVDGALAPLADSYREELRRLGYGPRSGLRQMDLLADLSGHGPSWMAMRRAWRSADGSPHG